MNTLPSENPLATRNYSYSSSQETSYRSTTTNASNFEREQYHPRESSPSITNRNRSPSPVTGYVASSTTRATSSTYTPQHDYRSVSVLRDDEIFLSFDQIFRRKHHPILISINAHHHLNQTIDHKQV